MKEHHLILGGRGFIGRHVAVLLARMGNSVVLADRLPPEYDFPLELTSRISWRPLEFASADWDSLVADASVVHHYAWTSIPASANGNPVGDLTSNVTGTLAVLEALRRRGKGCLVFPSSGGTVYGRLQQLPASENHPLAPVTAYGAGKAAAEIYLGLYQTLYGIDCRVARIGNPYGAGQNVLRGQGALSTFIHHAVTGRQIVIWGDGEVVRDYVHISDVARALVMLALAPHLHSFSIFNIGSGIGSSLNCIILELEHQLNRRLEVKRMPSRPFDVPVSILDISRARDVIGWAPRLSLRQGIEQTIEDMSAQAEISTMD